MVPVAGDSTIPSPIEPKAPDHLREPLPGDAERFGGARALAVGGGQRRLDEAALEVGARSFERGLSFGGTDPRDMPGQRGGADPASPGGMDSHPRHHVLKLSNVSGPVVA